MDRTAFFATLNTRLGKALGTGGVWSATAWGITVALQDLPAKHALHDALEVL